MNKQSLILLMLIVFSLPTIAEPSLKAVENNITSPQIINNEQMGLEFSDPQGIPEDCNDTSPLELLSNEEAYNEGDNTDLSPLTAFDGEEESNLSKPLASKHTKNFWQIAWGEPAPDALLGLGAMKSFHLGENNRKYRTWNYLVGGQFKGVTAGTFINSHNRRVYLVGVSRSVYHKESKSGVNFDLGYKLGGFYGYREGFPNYHGFMAGALLVAGIGYKALGIDVMYPVGSNVVTLSGHLYLDPIIDVFKPKNTKHKASTEILH